MPKPRATMPPLALKAPQAAKALAISRSTLWRLRNLDDSDPMKIRPTPYGTYDVRELQRHLAEATKGKK